MTDKSNPVEFELIGNILSDDEYLEDNTSPANHSPNKETLSPETKRKSMKL